MKELFKHYTLVKLIKDPALSFHREVPRELMLHLIIQKVKLFLIADIFKLKTHMRSITCLQMSKNIAKRGNAQADHITCLKLLIHISFREAVKGQVDICP